MSRLILLGLTVLLLFPAAGWTAEALPKPTRQPIEVTAQQLEALQQQGQAIFSGEVVAKQGDITLYCDRLVVFNHPDRDEVERLEASGSVRVVQLDRIATADRAVYRQADETLVLTGNAQVHQGQNRVSGEEILVHLRENRSLVKSGEKGRVRAVLFPEPKQAPQ